MSESGVEKRSLPSKGVEIIDVSLYRAQERLDKIKQENIQQGETAVRLTEASDGWKVGTYPVIGFTKAGRLKLGYEDGNYIGRVSPNHYGLRVLK